MKNLYSGYPDAAGSLFAMNAAGHKYEVLIEQSLSAFFLTIPDGTILETNEAATTMFGYSTEEFKTITRRDLIDHSDPGFLMALKQREKNGFARVEATGIKKNGDRFPVSVFSAFFTNALGQVRTSTIVNNLTEQKKIEKDLQQVLDSITDGFFTVDNNWTVKCWNSQLEKITGIPNETIIGKNFWLFYNSPNKKNIYSKYKKTLRKKTPINFEEYYAKENIWLEITICPHASGISIFFKNITETRRLRELERIEKEFLESNTRTNSNLETNLSYYLKAIEQIHTGMICSVLKLKDNKLYNWASPSLPEKYCAVIEGVSIGASAGSCGTAAFKKEKVIVTDIENDSRWVDYKNYALQEGLRSCWSFPIFNSKKEVMGTFAIYYTTIKTPTADEEKTIERARNILAVILEHKMAEVLLQNSVESYRYLFNNNPSSIIIWDTTYLKIIEVNDTAIALYGYQREEFLQLTILDIYPEAEQSIFAEVVSQARNNNLLKKSMRWHHVTKAGTKIIIEVSSHDIIYNEKKAVLALGNNVTEKVQLENSLLEERKIRQKQITDAVITGQEKERVEIGQELHDNINQILATAKLYLECAQVQKKFSAKLIGESKMLTEKAMYEIRKLSNSLLPPSLEEIGLQEAINDLVQHIRSVNTLHIKNNWIEFDENSLNKKLKLTIFRIVQEQLNNIIKHAHATHAIINITQKEEQLCVCIEDDGIGFDTSKKRNGVGLKNIISRSEVNNGKVSILSKPGEGCIMTVCFTTFGFK
ncbi:PAS domain S-box protein [Ferruginibacter sp. SUN106]|uniref:sensor histidine kinase n=1 Tax=Ferruginibacter sp. SUN106 TaxID=2978348 RepID=UPI003D3629FE